MGHGQQLCEMLSTSDKGVRSYCLDTMLTDGLTDGQMDSMIPIYPKHCLRRFNKLTNSRISKITEQWYDKVLL